MDTMGIVVGSNHPLPSYNPLFRPFSIENGRLRLLMNAHHDQRNPNNKITFSTNLRFSLKFSVLCGSRVRLTIFDTICR